MTIAIELRDEVAERLRCEAQRQNLTLEQLLSKEVEQFAARSEEALEELMDEIIEKNAELYRRLA